MRVLLFCPTKRLEPETVKAVFALQGEPVDFLFTRDNPHVGEAGVDARYGEAGKQNILHNYRKGRRAALDGGYDAMLCLESDIIPPPDALSRLLAIEGDVNHGTYMFRSGSEPVINIARHARTAGCPDVSLRYHPLVLRAQWGNVIPCTGLGLGCTLIHRRVLEQVDFRLAPEGGHCDWAFACDAISGGWRLMADLGLHCGHKRPDGVILWPSVRGWRQTEGEVA